jgi:hypothetical protein
LHIDYAGYVSGDIFVPSNYTAIVKTTFVFAAITFAGAVLSGFFAYYTIENNPE